MKIPFLLRLTALGGLLFLHQNMVRAQSKILEVIGSTGQEGAVGNMVVTSTLGEAVTLTLSGAAAALTQGFQQDVRILVSVDAGEPATLAGFSVFPNPTAAAVTLRRETPFGEQLAASLFDASGKRLFLDENLAPGDSQHTFDLSAHPPGTYFLLLQNPGGRSRFQIVKL